MSQLGPSQHRGRFRARIYPAYRSTTVDSGPKRMATNRLLAQYEHQFGRYLPEPGPALDIGCGQGEFVLFLTRRGWEACGVDVSDEQVAIAHANGVNSVRQGDFAAALSEHRDYYQLITAFNVLEHLDRDELLATMDDAVAALRPGGRFMAMVPNAKGLFGSNVRYADLTHELSFTPISVQQLCSVVGLRLITIFENGPIPHGVRSAVRWLVWQVIRGCLVVARLAEGADTSWPVFTQDLVFVAKRPETD